MSSYHGWTHAPKAQGGTDPIPGMTGIPFFRAYAYNLASQTVNDDQQHDLRFDRWQTSDAAIFDSSGWNAGSPDYIDGVFCYQRGLYLINVTVNVDEIPGASGHIAVALEDQGATTFSPPSISMSAVDVAGDGSTGFPSFFFMMSYPPIWVADVGGANSSDTLGPDLPEWRFSIFNNTGASIDIDAGTMVEIHQLYAFDYETAVGTIQSQA